MDQDSQPAGQTLETEQLLDELVAEISERLHAGQSVDLDRYTREHPNVADELRRMLPALEALAELGNLPPAGEIVEAPSSGRRGLTRGALGDFRIAREIGRGGMGVVYEAEQISLGRPVALKVLPFAGVLDAKQLQRFKNEAHAAAQLHHQNIVPVYSVGCERGVHYYAMQYIDGQTLAEVVCDLRRLEGLDGEAAEAGEAGFKPADSLASGRFAPRKETPGPCDPTAPHSSQATPESPSSEPDTYREPQAAISTERSTKSLVYFRSIARIGVQVAEALDHAHEHGVIHRDVKPSNVILDANGNAWITDFGLARVETGATLTISGDLLGTIRYMSPEQSLAKRILVDHRTDVYSLGVTLYELLVLRPAFTGRDRQELLRQIAFDEPQPPRRLNRAVPVDLEIIVNKAMAKNPAERYATAQDLADDLKRYLDDKPIKAKRPSLTNRLAKWSRRHKLAVASAATIAATSLLALAIGAWVYATQAQAIADKRVEVNQRISQALVEVERARDQAKQSSDYETDAWTAARQAAARANALAEHDLADPKLRRGVDGILDQLERDEKEYRFVAQIERIRMEIAAPRHSTHGTSEVAYAPGSTPGYQAIFANRGIDPATTSPEAAAKWLHDRPAPIRERLIAILHDWLRFYDNKVARSEEKKEEIQWLGLVLDKVDEDPWRRDLREAIRDGNRQKLLQLAGDPTAAGQPPHSVLLLGTALFIIDRPTGIDLLKRSQRLHPEDFWLNRTLAHKVSDKAAAARYASAALALRPNDGHVLFLFGSILEGLDGELDEAIATYERASQFLPEGLGMRAQTKVVDLLLDNDEGEKAAATFHQIMQQKVDTRCLMCLRVLESAFADLGGKFRERGAPELAADAYLKSFECTRALARLQLNGKPIHICGEPFLNGNVKTARSLAEFLHECGRLDEGLTHLRQIMRQMPELEHPIRRVLVETYVRHQRWTELAAALEPVANRPTADRYADWWYRANLARALVNLNRREEAILQATKAVVLWPNGLGDGWGRGWASDYLDLWPSLITIVPDDPAAQNAWGGLFLRHTMVMMFSRSTGKDKDTLEEEALAAFREALRLDETYVPARYHLAELLRRRGQDEEAAKHLRIAVTQEPDNPRLQAAYASVLRRQGQHEDAIKHLQAAVTQQPQKSSVWIAYATALQEANRSDEVSTALRKWIELDPKDMWREGSGERRFAHEIWVHKLVDLGPIDMAVRCCEALIEFHPDRCEFWHWLLLARLTAKEEQGFRKDFTRLFKRFEEDKDIPVCFIAKHCALPPFTVSEFDRVVELARDSAKQHPEDPQTQHALGCILYRAGHFVEAAAALEQAAKLRRHTSFEDWIWQAMAEFRADNQDQAFAWLWKADEQLKLRRPPPWYVFEFQLLHQEALALMRVQLPGSELAETERRTRQPPKTDGERKDRERQEKERGRHVYEQSIRILKRLTDLVPDVPEHLDSLAEQYHELGGLLKDLNQMEAARTNYEKAIDLRKDLADRFPHMQVYRVQLAGSCCDLGSVLRDHGEPEAALRCYSRGQELLEGVLRDSGDDRKAEECLRDVHWNRADTLARLGRHADAFQDYERAVELTTRTFEQDRIRENWMLALAHAKDWDAALAQAASLAETQNAPDSRLYYCACVFALASGARSDDAKLQEQYAVRAMDLLRKARDKGFRSIEKLKDSDLDALRQRADFQQFVKEMDEESTNPAKDGGDK